MCIVNYIYTIQEEEDRLNDTTMCPQNTMHKDLRQMNITYVTENFDNITVAGQLKAGL